MPKVNVNNIEIEYDTFGDPSSKPLLLIMGLGTQMIAWSEEMCEIFANKGLYVIRFDNRDVGLSTKCEYAGLPDLEDIYTKDGDSFAEVKLNDFTYLLTIGDIFLEIYQIHAINDTSVVILKGDEVLTLFIGEMAYD